jgi:hypothetical protein
MNKSLIAAPLVALLLSACVVAPPGRGPGVGIGIGLSVPALPLVVELGSDPYYSHGGYTYYYDNDRWRYADSRAGPWVDLPRSLYPRETRFRGRQDGRDRDRDRDGIPNSRDRDRDGDNVPDRRDSAPNDPRRN